jgi:hypothetical protein
VSCLQRIAERDHAYGNASSGITDRAACYDSVAPTHNDPAIFKRGAPATDLRRANPMLRIWGRLSSINVQKVVWCADELDLPYERTEAGGTFGVADTPQYLAMNPNGLVPLIEDDGFVL